MDRLIIFILFSPQGLFLAAQEKDGRILVFFVIDLVGIRRRIFHAVAQFFFAELARIYFLHFARCLRIGLFKPEVMATIAILFYEIMAMLNRYFFFHNGQECEDGECGYYADQAGQKGSSTEREKPWPKLIFLE